MPHVFLKKVAALEKISLPEAGRYGVAMIYFPKNAAQRDAAQKAFESIVREEGQTFLGWRKVPTDNRALGQTAIAGEPDSWMAFIQGDASLKDILALERKLYVIRKRAEHTIRPGEMNGSNTFYIPSLSARTLVYKGMLLSGQVEDYYPDLKDKELVSALGLVHSRFSTNTFPNWNRAHPYRYIIHNGEINTLRQHQLDAGPRVSPGVGGVWR
jgi:glutamate synthase (ferredoxin)